MRIIQPSCAIIESHASEETIENARKNNEDWAMSTQQPPIHKVIAFMTQLNDEAARLDNPKDNWVPNSYNEAMQRPDLWRNPMNKEIANMHKHQVWTLVDRPPGVKLMRNRWTYANKYDTSGNVIDRKARLVAKGFSQIPGVDYFEMYASVVRYESLRMNLAIAAAKDMEAWQVDYVSAYLNSPTQVPIHMTQPEGYEVPPKTDGSPEKVALVTKALYGTMDGAYNWAKSLNADMKNLGYYRSQADPSVRSRNVDSEITITCTYTDDVTGISSTPEGGALARRELTQSYKTKDLGDAKLILGIRIDRDREAGTLTISQRAYLERVLARYGMSNCSPQYTPLPVGVILEKSQVPTTTEDHQYMKDKPYREVLGSVMYAQIATRPDLSYAVTTLSKFSSNPGREH